MEIQIVTKKIDEFKSKTFKGKTLNEYIVYQMIDGQPIKAGIALGEEAKTNLEFDFLIS